MSNLGWFDAKLQDAAWFDLTTLPLGWLDATFIGAAYGTGTAYNDTHTATATGGAAAVSTLVQVGVITEAGAANHSSGATVSLSGIVTEAPSASSSHAAILTLSSLISEAVTAATAGGAVLTIPASLSEPASPGSAQGISLVQAVGHLASGVGAESSTTTVSYAVVQQEPSASSDQSTVTASVGSGVTEGAVATSAQTNTAQMVASVSEAGNPSSSQSGTLLQPSWAAETTTAGTTHGVALSVPSGLQEAATATDGNAVSVIPGFQTLNETIAEPVSAGDYPVASATSSHGVSEAATITDSASAGLLMQSTIWATAGASTAQGSSVSGATNITEMAYPASSDSSGVSAAVTQEEGAIAGDLVTGSATFYTSASELGIASVSQTSSGAFVVSLTEQCLADLSIGVTFSMSDGVVEPLTAAALQSAVAVLNLHALEQGVPVSLVGSGVLVSSFTVESGAADHSASENRLVVVTGQEGAEAESTTSLLAILDSDQAEAALSSDDAVTTVSMEAWSLAQGAAADTLSCGKFIVDTFSASASAASVQGSNALKPVSAVEVAEANHSDDNQRVMNASRVEKITVQAGVRLDINTGRMVKDINSKLVMSL